MKALTNRQKEVLATVPAEWAEMRLGCTNSTVNALEKRGLIETRIMEGQRSLLFCKWEWRLTPDA